MDLAGWRRPYDKGPTIVSICRPRIRKRSEIYYDDVGYRFARHRSFSVVYVRGIVSGFDHVLGQDDKILDVDDAVAPGYGADVA